MVPTTIRRLLRRLRWRERWLGFSRAASLWTAVFLLALVVACVVDFLVDREMETPVFLKGVFFIVKAVLTLGLLVYFFDALLKTITDRQAALWVEEATPDLRHRLITAVELNRPDAKRQGMSDELIDAVTKQAETRATTIRPWQVLDGGRFTRAALLLLPVLLLCVGLYLASPAKAFALLQRQFLADVEVPRSLEIDTPESQVWPAGEKGTIRLCVRGEIPEESVFGELRLTNDDGSDFRLKLEQAEAGTDIAWYEAQVPPLDSSFHFSARLADGRTRSPGRIEYVPRPVVQSIEAKVVLPERIGLGKRGLPYTERQRGGDILYRVSGSSGLVTIVVQRPVKTANLHLFSREKGKDTFTKRTLTQEVEGDRAGWVFDFKPGDSHYEIEVIDKHGIGNLQPWPKRTINDAQPESPEVVLLQEYYPRPGYEGPMNEDFEGEGAPVFERVPMAYKATSRYGISHLRLRFQVIRKVDLKESAGAIDLEAFRVLNLGPIRGAKRPFAKKALVEWSTRPPAHDEEVPDVEGQGRYDLELKGIVDLRPEAKGALLTVVPGDRIQFYIEAFSKASPDEMPGRSVLREKEVVTLEELLAWFENKLNLTQLTRELEKQQRENRPTIPPEGSPGK